MKIQAISQMTRETATMASCLPRLRAMRRYIAPSRVSVLDGKWLLRTNDETLTPGDLAAAYKQLIAVAQ